MSNQAWHVTKATESPDGYRSMAVFVAEFDTFPSEADVWDAVGEEWGGGR